MICEILDTGLCKTCSELGRKTTNQTSRTLELGLLCKSCLRKTKTSYVCTVKQPRKYWAETLPESKEERY